MKNLFYVLGVFILFSSCKSAQRTQDQSLLVDAPVEETTTVDPESPAGRNPDVKPITPMVDPVSPSESTPSDEPVVAREEAVSMVNNTDGVKRFNVIVGSFGVLDNAQNRKSTLAEKGYSSDILKKEDSSTTLYRVTIGSFNDETQARELISKVRIMDGGEYQDAWLLIAK